LVTIVLFTMGTDFTHPLIQTLPMRQLRITIPDLDPTGKPYVQFEATFGLQLGDPWTIWGYLLNANRQAQMRQRVLTATATPATTTAVHGALYSGTFSASPNGTLTTFQLPNDFGYIAGTTQIYLNGLFQRRANEYSESDPTGGAISFVSAPVTGDEVWILCRLL
jgi:hypothetical protein